MQGNAKQLNASSEVSFMSELVHALNLLNRLVRDKAFSQGLPSIDHKERNARVQIGVFGGKLSIKVLMTFDPELGKVQVQVRDYDDGGLLRIESFVRSDARDYEYFLNLNMPAVAEGVELYFVIKS